MSGRSKVRDIVYEEERQTVTIPIMFNRSSVPVKAKTIIISEEPVVVTLQSITEVPFEKIVACPKASNII